MCTCRNHWVLLVPVTCSAGFYAPMCLIHEWMVCIPGTTAKADNVFCPWQIKEHVCVCVFVCTCTFSPRLSSECYRDECVPYVQHVSTDHSVQQGEDGDSFTSASVYGWLSISDVSWEKKVTLFLGGGDRWELGKVFLGEEAMDGNNILLVVSASRENYLSTTNIYSSLSYFISLCFRVPCSPYSCRSTLTIRLSLLSLSILLPPRCLTHVYFDT